MVLLFSAFVVATCGLVYELLTGALASYLLGDSITQFSTVIGTYLFAMGIGSFLSKYVQRNHLIVFIQVEILVGFIGGCSAAALFLLFEHVAYFRVLLYLSIFTVGVLVGLEIPLLMQILKDKMSFRDVVSRVLGFDYLGALFASVLFPLFFIPHLGLVKTGFFFGILNTAVALWVVIILGKKQVWAKILTVQAAVVLVLLVLGFLGSERIMSFAEAAYYPDQIIYAKSTPYQRIIVTKNGASTRLYLNGHLQFDSNDEYRYHESLVHVGLYTHNIPEEVLILGGGDGLAVRELLKYEDIKRITLIDLDSGVTDLFKNAPFLRAINQEALLSSRLTIVNADAFVWLREHHQLFEYIIVDLPDPTNFSIAKLYSTTFYRTLKEHLTPTGRVVIQTTSPLLARKSYWCVEKSLREAGLYTLPFHTFVPSFGEWGYILASPAPLSIVGETAEEVLPAALRYITPVTIPGLFTFPPDMSIVSVEANRLSTQALLTYYEQEWGALSSL